VTLGLRVRLTLCSLVYCGRRKMLIIPDVTGESEYVGLSWFTVVEVEWVEIG
jgi:hypothetical protein